MWPVAIRWENTYRNHWYEASKPHVLNHRSLLYCGIESERGRKRIAYAFCTDCLTIFKTVPRVVCSLLAMKGKVENTISITWHGNPCHLASQCC